MDATPGRGARAALRVRRTSPADHAERAMLARITAGQVRVYRHTFIGPDGTPFTDAEHKTARAVLFGGAARLAGGVRNPAVPHPLLAVTASQ